jgi:hypothetical protein
MRHNSKRENLTKSNLLLETKFLGDKQYLLNESKVEEITKVKTEALSILSGLKNRHSGFVKTQIENKEKDLRAIDPNTACSKLDEIGEAKSGIESAKSMLTCHPEDKTDLAKLEALIGRIPTLCKSSSDGKTEEGDKEGEGSEAGVGVETKVLPKIFGDVKPGWGDNKNSGYENGPKNHGARAFGNWESDNAWDIFAKPGTKVYAILPGKVKKVRVTNKTTGKVFGTQVSITGTEGNPNTFYTHLKNVKLSVGNEISVGDLVGEISEWDSAPTITHVHIGIDDKKHIKEYLSVDGTLLKGSGKSSESSDGDGESVSGDTKSTYDDAYSGFFGKGGSSTLFDLFGSFGKMMTPQETSEVTENVNEIKKIFKKLL